MNPIDRLRRSLSAYSWVEKQALEREPTAGFLWFDSRHDADMIEEAQELVKAGYLQEGTMKDYGEESQYSQLRFYFTDKILSLL